jgi:hypothetical protein
LDSTKKRFRENSLPPRESYQERRPDGKYYCTWIVDPCDHPGFELQSELRYVDSHVAHIIHR